MRIAVVSDIHANRVALQAVLADAGRVDETWCLGDLVGYGPEPNECIDLLRQREPDSVCIAGNHDWAALGRLDTAEFNSDAKKAAAWTRDRLTPGNRLYLENLPQSIVRSGFTLVHGTPRDPIWEYLVSPQVALACFPLLATRFCLVGHSHLPFACYEVTGSQPGVNFETPTPGKAIQLGAPRAFVNPGSVGQPRDGNPDASYVVLDTDTLTFEHRRVAYDIAQTQSLMKAAGLPERLIMRLSYGW
jgi:diadenosine tetraphosphatase ApaH/serine/threonine PP2A family protein phosphatase